MKESSVHFPGPGAFLMNDEEDSFLFSLRERSPSPPRIRTESVQPISPSNDREIDNDDDDGGAKYMMTTTTTTTTSPRKRLSLPLRSNDVTTVNQSPSPASTSTASSIVDHTNNPTTNKRSNSRRWRENVTVILVIILVAACAKSPATNYNSELSFLPSPDYDNHHHHSPTTAAAAAAAAATTTTSISRTTIIERRGGGLLTTHTACRISLWIWYSIDGKIPDKPKNQLCDTIKHQGQHVGHQLRNVNDLRQFDTVYVPFTSVNDFVTTILPHITVDIVIISGHPFNVAPPSSTNIQQLVNHTHVIAWFCQNIPKYSASNPTHIKIFPFPYGLNEKENKLGLMTYPAYKTILFDGLRNETISTITAGGRRRRVSNNSKSIFIYAGPLKTVEPKAMSKSGAVVVVKHNNTTSTTSTTTASKKASVKYNNIGGGDGRRNIPGSKSYSEYKKERLLPIDYFTNIYNSKYILSPNGDRPECFRHYEALGLGTVPITELDSKLGLFRHLLDGPVIYDNRVWNVTLLGQTLDPYPIVNRNLIREDYWMNWMEEQIGNNVQLTWNDRLRVPSAVVDDDDDDDEDDDKHDEDDASDNGNYHDVDDKKEKKGDNNGNGKRYHNGLTDEENELLALLDYSVTG